MKTYLSDNMKTKYLLLIMPLLAVTFACNPPEPVEVFDSMEGLIINEVSPAKSMGKEAWIEIYNTNDRNINLKGLKIVLTDASVTDEVIAVLSDGTIEAKGRHVVSSDKVEFSSPVLRSTMEEIGIWDPDGSPVNSFSVKYDLESTAKPEDGGSFARIPDISGDWTITSTATPGEANYKIIYHPIKNLVINEVCPSAKWVELVNTGSAQLQLEYCLITAKGGKVLCTIPPETVLPEGERIVIECAGDAADLNQFSFCDNSGKSVVSFSSEGLQATASGESWSRLPDISGEWKVTHEPTRGKVNESSTTDDSGLVINEVSLEGWIEVANTTVENISSAGFKITADGAVVHESGKTTIKAGGKFVASVGVAGHTTFALVNAAGKTLDTFSVNDVRKDSREATASTSWSRLPDGTGKWFTVLTPSKGEKNYGIEVGNTIGIWVNQSATNSIVMEDFCKLGIGNILLHEWAFKNYGTAKVQSLVKEAEALGMKVHIWLQCFWWNDDTQWRCPVIDATDTTPAAYNQSLFDEVISRALTYEKAGVHGIHFDYVRFPGTGSKHNFPSDGITATGAITEFCRQANQKLKAQNQDIILSAALMGERSAQSYYGQDPEQMSQYIDILMPMAYISAYNYSSSTNIAVANWFAARCGNGQVWHGISTYDSSSRGLTVEELYRDCKNITGSNAHGIVLFRHGFGNIPDLTGMFAK